MASNGYRLHTVVALAAAAALGFGYAAPVAAGKPSWAGNGGGNGHGKPEKSYEGNGHGKPEKSYEGNGHGKADNDRGGHRDWDGKQRTYFKSQDRTVVHNYYEREYHKGKGCPPGLAKKHNGCMPPGQAKKWRYGHTLPRDVVWYPVPRELVIQLPAPPSGYKYVRVASDILMIAVGSSMVVDAITDLGQL